ncbi:MAG: 4-hydroxybenzoate octaprenyltransferase [Stagnimonas sp.]|nr:4-hydroxybenzoate octaprenyltransferase [Stagnimonas sp.]
MLEKLMDYLRLCRLHKPVGIWLLLWPTLWGLWFAAGGMPPTKVLWVFALGVVLMRSAGCVINDVMDKDFDPKVERTKDRPIAAGRVTRSEGVRVFVGLALIAYGLTTKLNVETVLLSIPAVLLAASYPLMKRWIALPQAYLGLAFSWGIPMAYSAIQGHIDWPMAGLLMAANICWVVAYDTFYAMVDREDDLKIGVKSAAVLFGQRELLITSLLHAAALALLALAGARAGLGLIYFAGLAVAAVIAFALQRRARSRSRADAFAAFQHSHWFGAAVLLGLVIDTL